jgi:hypothetical protein
MIPVLLGFAIGVLILFFFHPWLQGWMDQYADWAEKKWGQQNLRRAGYTPCDKCGELLSQECQAAKECHHCHKHDETQNPLSPKYWVNDPNHPGHISNEPGVCMNCWETTSRLHPCKCSKTEKARI